MYISRYHKSRHVTDRDFHVVRYLPYKAGGLIYYYLVYIRPFQGILRRVCAIQRSFLQQYLTNSLVDEGRKVDGLNSRQYIHTQIPRDTTRVIT
jgi:hypothetical protein